MAYGRKSVTLLLSAPRTGPRASPEFHPSPYRPVPSHLFRAGDRVLDCPPPFGFDVPTLEDWSLPRTPVFKSPQVVKWVEKAERAARRDDLARGK
jgi:hypothetical protein